MNDIHFMQQAIAQAEIALSEGEMPVGCVIVKDGQIIARGRNARENTNDPTAHAEIIAMRNAAREMNSWRLEGCTLYVTLEPCPMCAGAISQARLSRLVYGAADEKYGCAGSLYRIPEDPAFSHFCKSEGGVMEKECALLIRRFFAEKR